MSQAAAGKAVVAAERHLRVSMLWNTTLQGEETLERPQVVKLGYDRGSLFPIPEGVVPDDSLVVLEPLGHGYRLKLSPQLGGDVWLGGVRKEVRRLSRESAHVALGPDDYGVVTVGPVAVFFQHVRAARKLPHTLLGMDGPQIAGLLLSLFLHASLFVLFLFMKMEMPEPDPLELPTDLIRRFMVVPPPEDILENARQSGTEVEDPGLRAREETGGERAEGAEGRVGRENARQENTEIAGENRGAVAMQKLNEIGVPNAIADALQAPSISDVLSGLGSSRTVVGRGSGGMGLRGTGSGGGGTGPGTLFGAGDVGTGVGAGRGGGLGRGSGGIGVPGRQTREAQVRLTTAAPRVSGYLSAEQINRVVRANQAAIRYCYEVEVQRAPNMRGRVEIQWRINLQGQVTSARVASSSLSNARVEGCMVRQIRRWRFPEPDGGEVVVTYPFIFGIQGG